MGRGHNLGSGGQKLQKFGPDIFPTTHFIVLISPSAELRRLSVSGVEEKENILYLSFATGQIYEYPLTFVCLSVRPSVCPLYLFCGRGLLLRSGSAEL